MSERALSSLYSILKASLAQTAATPEDFAATQLGREPDRQS